MAPHPPLATDPTDLLVRAAAAAQTPADLHAAEALAEAMAGWDADEVACYREAVTREVERLGATPPDGFLAAEALALAWLDGVASLPTR